MAFALVTTLLAPAAPVISEILASNQTGLTDRDGDRSDWIELHNPDGVPVELDGWYLTDNAGNRTKWRLPAVSIPPGGFLVVFASSKDRRDPAGELHTNFALSADGEYLGLIGPDGSTAVAEFAPAFPGQAADVSYGLPGNTGTAAFLQAPTPGAANRGAAVRETVRITPGARTFSVALQVELEGAVAGQEIRYELIEPSEAGLAAPAPTAASRRYDAPITLTTSTLVRAAVFSSDGATGPVATALFTRVAEADDAAVNTFTSGLPIVVLDPHGRGPITKETGKLPGWLQLFEPGEDVPARLLDVPSVTGPIEFGVRGSTSAESPKQGFSLELKSDSGGNRPLPLLGLANTEDWALVSPWSFDPSYLRNAYVYALSNRLGRWAPRTRFVEVFVKAGGAALDRSHYAGLSVLTERIKIDPELVPLTPLKASDTTAPAVTGGYLLKFDPKDDDEYGWVTNRGFPLNEGIGAGTMLVVAAPKAGDLVPAQRDYIRNYVQAFEDALFADRDGGWATRRYRNYIDVGSWVDFHLLQVLTKNPDGLARSAYFTKDRDGKLKAGPVWDFDRALGANNDARSLQVDEWSHPTQSSPLWEIGWWGVLARDPAFRQDWIDRWQTLRRGTLGNEALVALTTSLAAGIDPAAAERDAARWPDNIGRNDTGFRGEVDHLARWLVQRAQWIDAQFVAPPLEASSGGTRTIIAPPGLLIAYTLDGTDPRGADGKPSAGAIVVPGPLTLADGTYTIRIYDPAAAAVFPGTPWSAPRTLEVTVGSGTPSGPSSSNAPQLINLATRGIVDGPTTLVSGLSVPAGAAKRYLIRGVGPTLALFGVGEALADPILRVYDSNGAEIVRNQDWRTNPDRAAFISATAGAGAFPLAESSRDAAVIVTLNPGTYTVEVASERSGRGAALAEVYALEPGSELANLSTRAGLGEGESLIGGVTLSGSAPRRLLIRAIGPSLTQFGVTNALSDPVLAVYAGQILLAANDDWSAADDAAEIAALAAASGAFPLAAGAKDAAVLVAVPPGAYTVHAFGKAESGTTLIEVYDVPADR
ncbi:MAG: CotH kinase family protein [Opitutaceae bacterium]|nr:CotH kinase family protein [Opitutaceae bacterium]